MSGPAKCGPGPTIASWRMRRPRLCTLTMPIAPFTTSPFDFLLARAPVHGPIRDGVAVIGTWTVVDRMTSDEGADASRAIIRSGLLRTLVGSSWQSEIDLERAKARRTRPRRRTVRAARTGQRTDCNGRDTGRFPVASPCPRSAEVLRFRRLWAVPAFRATGGRLDEASMYAPSLCPFFH